jgi:pilus assembly protein Flp/PilA
MMNTVRDRFYAAQGWVAAKLLALKRDEEGATMIEYALIAALVAVAAIAVLTTLGTDITAKFQAVVDALK